jgi:hypothetical protein
LGTKIKINLRIKVTKIREQKLQKKRNNALASIGGITTTEGKKIKLVKQKLELMEQNKI